MKPFKFRLDRVIKLHRSSRQSLQADLSDIHSDLGTLSTALTALRKEMRSCIISPGFNIVNNYRQNLRKQIASLEEQEEELCTVAAQVMELISAATAKEKGLENLREKRECQHRKQMKMKEQKTSML